MANEIRLRRNNESGTITDNPLAIGATTINSAAFATLPTVDGSNHLILILDPQEVGGSAEIVRVTAHTAAATSLTVVRGQEGSVARSHVFNTTWMHGPVTSDTIEVLTSSTRPNVPYEGELLYETDTDRHTYFDVAASLWRPVTNPPRAGASRSTNLSITNGAWNLVTFTTEDIDTDNMFTTGTGDRFTCVTPGRYLVVFTVAFAANTTGLRGYALAKGVVAATGFFAESLLSVATSGGHGDTVSGEVVLAAAETVSCQVFQNSGGALNITPGAGTEPCRATIRWVAPS